MKDLVKVKKIITHSGKFHTDDVMSPVFLLKMKPDLEVIRIDEYETDDFNEEELVFDIGGGMFDHHGPEREINDYGDPFSSFGKLKNIDVDELDITYLLEDTITLLKPLFKQNKGKIIFSSKEEIYIKGDYNKLKQVFINLLKNTIEAKKEYENLIVEIKIKKENKQIILTIKDNGIGMDKATLKKVSEVFFTTKQNGTGIGLAFSKEVIELHKGQLLINSKLNEGTEIKIIFPNEKVRRL